MILISHYKTSEVLKPCKEPFNLLTALVPRILVILSLITIIAGSSPAMAGIIFYENGENVMPYTIAGDDSGDYYAWNVGPGTSTIEAIPFGQSDATGNRGDSFNIKPNIVDEPFDNQEVAELLNTSDDWIKVGEGDEQIVTVTDSQEGECLEVWSGIAPEATGVHFWKNFGEPQDFSNFDKIFFLMKGNGIRNALKIGLMDQNGRRRTYGPFWTDNENWAQFEFIPAIATWPDDYDDESFQLSKITSLYLLQENDAGPARPVLLKDIACPPEEEQEFPDQWVNENIDPNGNMVINGKKFLPVGIYTPLGVDAPSADSLLSALNTTYSDQLILDLMDKIRLAGFNTIQSYTVPYYCSGSDQESRISGQEKLLSMAESAGLKVMLNIGYLASNPIQGTPEEVAAETAVRQAEMKATVLRVKDSPALLAYYIADEPFNVGIPRIQLESFYRIIKKNDKKHPIILVEWPVAGFSLYQKAADVMAPDLYPVDAISIPNIEEIANVIDSIDGVLPFEQPYLWNLVQIQKAYDKSAPFDNLEQGRYPTAKELRAMTVLSLRKDVKGLFFFSMGGMGGQPVIPEQATDVWDDVSAVLNNIGTMLPVVFSEQKADDDFTVSNSRVQAMGKIVNVDGSAYLYIIAVLPSVGSENATISVTFSGILDFADTQIEVLDENPSGVFSPGQTRIITGTAVEGSETLAFSDTFDNNTTHVYRIELP